MERSLFGFLCVALWPGAAWAQAIQNMDMSLLFGPSWVHSQTIAGSNVTLSGSYGFGLADQLIYGYEVRRSSTGGLWVELAPLAFSDPGGITAGSPVPEHLDNMTTFTAGVRYMVPLASRLSVYGALGGGIGFFNYAAVQASAAPTIQAISTTHGLVDFGGGVDIRLVQFLSVRIEARDYVTGDRLSGAPGRQHLVPVAGIAWHF